MVTLPFKALALLFTRPKLFFLSLFPGIFTFALSSVAVYGVWATFLQEASLWLSIPFMMMAFLISWLIIGNLSLIPVEDAIIDECQKAVWGEVRLESPRMSLRRILREAGFSVFLAICALFFFILSFIPVIGLISFVLIAWMTAYGFLSSLYARKAEEFRLRFTFFFSHALSNLALGFLIGFLLFVPVLNVLLLGYAQVLASLVFLRREDRIITA